MAEDALMAVNVEKEIRTNVATSVAMRTYIMVLMFIFVVMGTV